MRFRILGYQELAKSNIALKQLNRKDYMIRESLLLERIRILKLIDIQKEFKKLENKEKESMKEIAPIPMMDDKQVETIAYLSETRMRHFSMNIVHSRIGSYGKRW